MYKPHVPDESLVRFRRAVAAALAELETRRQEVNDLNVFPVADGDTGDNMAMTMRAVLDELNRMNGQPLDVLGRDEIVDAVARAALLGARGNSGVILSQIVRGAAEELAGRPGELVDPVLVAAAFARAADAAYASVRDPAEGTMLTAVRAMAQPRGPRPRAHGHASGSAPTPTPREQDELLAEVLEHALEAGKEAVERGPDQLAVLREAGVVDAGAYGLTVIVAGCLAALRGRRRARARAPARAGARSTDPSTSPRASATAPTSRSPARGSTPARSCRGSRRSGDSVLVVGDERTLRVHVHTDDPERAVARVRRGRARCRASTSRTCTSRSPTAAPGSPGHAPQPREATCAVVAVASGARRPPALRGARRAGRGRRRHDEPLHLRAARRRPRRRRPTRCSCCPTART